MTTIDLFGGPGGWSEGLRALGMADVGVELDPAACATRAAAGHLTIRANVAALPLDHLAGQVDGLIASPPCPLFSYAGKGAGRALMDELTAAIADALEGRPTIARHRRTMARKMRAERLATTPQTRALASRHAWDDAGEAALTVQPARWIAATRPRWVALEQVPAVLPLWTAYARGLRALGYRTWCGILNAADYGVPQTRRRAFLIASLDRPVSAPAATHCRDGAATLFGDLAPWVTMAEALGWTGQGTPARTLCGARQPRWLYTDDGTHGRTVVGFPRRDDRGSGPDGYRSRDWHPIDEPASAITAKSRSTMVVTTGNNSAQADGTTKQYERPVDRPAPTLTGNVGRGWRLNPGRTESQPNRRPRTLDEPAPTIAFGHDAAAWAFERPATTLAGDPRVFTPGGHIAHDGRDNTRMLGRSENAIRLELADALTLQTFPPDYPVQGTRTAQFRQVGNAVPPLLAAHVLAVALGLEHEVAA